MVTKKEMDEMAKSIANEVLAGKKNLTDVMNQVNIENSEVVYNSNANAIRLLSESKPEMVYPKWDFFVEMLRSDNNYFKMNALYTIANLTKVDVENKFQKIFEEYYNLLDCDSLMIANHLAGVSGTIANAKPLLREKITEHLMKIDKTHFDQQRRDLIKGYAIQAFDEYFEVADSKKLIVEFVKLLTKSKSQTTAKKAKSFLKKRGLS